MNNKKQRFPWIFTLYEIRKRCTNPKSQFYYRYGGRGIKCLITAEELKELWFRDKAYEMKKPSIHRKDNDGNYCFENCEFIELSAHTIKHNNIVILQFDKQGNFIKKWESIIKASKTLKISNSDITSCAKGKLLTAGGYVWRYLNEFKNNNKIELDLRHKNCKKIIQLDLNYKPIKIWNSIKEASKTLNILQPCISACLLNESKTSGGFIWRYNDE